MQTKASFSPYVEKLYKPMIEGIIISPDVVVPLDVHLLEPLSLSSLGLLARVRHPQHDVPLDFGGDVGGDHGEEELLLVLPLALQLDPGLDAVLRPRGRRLPGEVSHVLVVKADQVPRQEHQEVGTNLWKERRRNDEHCLFVLKRKIYNTC